MKRSIKKEAGKSRGQISIFIIIAIIIVAIIVIYFLVNSGIKPGNNVDPTIAPLYSFVDNCGQETLADAIYYIGQSGGYYNIPEKSTETGIAYYVYDGSNLMPSKKQVEGELSSYINNMMFLCTKNFVDFPDLQVKDNSINSSVIIEDGKVIADISYPISITKGSKTYSLKNFNDIEYPVRLGVIYDVANQSVAEQLLHPSDICISCINNLAVDKNLYVEMNEYSNQTVIFSIIDKTSNVNNESYRFNFANKYPTK